MAPVCYESGDLNAFKTGSMHLAYSTPNLNEVEKEVEETARSLADDDFDDEADTKSVNLYGTIREAKRAMDLFLNNDFEAAEQLMKPMAGKSMYHALGHATLMFMKAMMTCERTDMTKAIDTSQAALNVISRFRAQYSLAESVYRIGGHYRSLTDEEIHAELCFAASLIQRALLTFFYDENMTSFIRGALKIRTCYQTYKECQRILYSQSWKGRDRRLKREFEAGVRIGLGTFNIMLSVLPSKLLKLLEFIGFSGDKAIGMRDMHITAGMNGTLMSEFARMNLISWELFVAFFLGHSKTDTTLCRKYLFPMFEKHPKGAIMLFMRGRYSLITGDIDSAIYFYNRSIESQYTYKQFHHVCYWELQFAYAMMRRWDRAANNAKRLKDESRWSRCVYTYLLAIYINADETEPNRFETVQLLMERIPQIRLRIAGKSIPVEKFCERKAKRFLAQGQLYFAHYEFMYFWNMFSVLEVNPGPYVEGILDDIHQVWKREPSADVNDVCIYEFMRGICYKTLRQHDNAERCLSTVVTLESQLTDNFYLVPTATLELALNCISQNRTVEAKAYLARARSYKGYPLENKLLFRIHATSDGIEANER